MESINNFKVGDRVKIARKIPSFYDGWQDSWVRAMDCLVGDERTIDCIYPEKKECRLVGTLWSWPLAALELVEETKQETKQETKPPKKPDGFALPSDEAGIEAMVKRMLGQPKKAPPAAPAPQKPPFHKGLLIQASEKYMGLGFNDKQ